jgi:hypothetical protein
MKQNSALNLLWAIGGTAAMMVANAEVANIKEADSQEKPKKERKFRYGDGLRVHFAKLRKEAYESH